MVQVTVQVQEPSLARSRVWAPLGLLLVLACGAWFFRGTAWQGAPGVSGGQAPVAGVTQAVPGQSEPNGALPDPDAKGEGPTVPPAAQVLEDVAQRGRQAPQAASATLSAESVQARVRQDAAAVHRQTAGQRLRLQGTLAAIEAGEPGVVVLHLALAGEPGTVRMVASPALTQVAASWVPPRAVALDCLSQGVMMGEWLLVDCRE